MTRYTPFSSKRMRLSLPVVLATLVFSCPALAVIADKPLAVSSGAPSNLMFILDDSASMRRAYLPDAIRYSYYNKFYYSSVVNRVWYNPDVEYKAPLSTNGKTRMQPASYTSAWEDGYDKRDTIDLSEDFEHRNFEPHRVAYWAPKGGFYTVLNYDLPGCQPNQNINSCFELFKVNEQSAEEKQNFANWYSYYRTRQFAARARISESFTKVDAPSRIGWGAIDRTGTIVQGVRTFDDAHQKAFREWLYEAPAPGASTPLRKALNDAGQYYERDDDFGPWSNTPGGTIDTEPHAACRQSFTMMMTDGAYNGPPANGIGNEDGNPGSNHSNPGDGSDFQYTPEKPFRDTESGTLADVAMHYWKRDLRPDIDNWVPTSGNYPGQDEPLDPAFWQHMVTMGITLGVTGDINPDKAFESIFTGSEVDWPHSFSGQVDRIDDLLHASVNSRGAFIDAADPESFEQGVSQLLASFNDRSELSASAAAASSAVLNADSNRFVAGFIASDWSGTLVSESIQEGTEKWNANEKLRSQASSGERNIFTNDGNGGVELDFAKLSNTQKNALNTALDGSNDNQGQQRVDWLQGESVSGLRDRSAPDGRRLLGDVVNSDPQIERKANFGFGQIGSGYGSYRSSDEYQNRTDALYVGANDGMLHAFEAGSGDELFAYMPSSVFEPSSNGAAAINELMDPDYDHRFYVDGTPRVIDANLSEGWTTVLVGTMGVGGDQVFALDVGDPKNFSPKDDVLWEFEDADLARGVQNAQVGKLANGEWAAVFGNGYGADAGYLYVVNLETGKQIAKISGGSAGVSTPVFTVDDGVVEYAYAGNQEGELYRFDLSSSNDKKWKSQKLFQATDPDGNAQPISSKPVVANMPRTKNQRVITFGTGKFFEKGDQSSGQMQSLYGVIDDQGSSKNIARKDLLEQTIIEDKEETVAVESDDGDGSSDETFTLREVSQKPLEDKHKGWVLDLDAISGERVVSQPTFPSGLDRSRVRFSTLIPTQNPCSAGTDGFLMEISLVSGGRVNEPVFDLDNDGKGDHERTSGVKGVLGGEKLTTIRDGDMDRIVDPKRDVNLLPSDMSAGRQFWRELRR